jgi:hypothetical protein
MHLCRWLDRRLLPARGMTKRIRIFFEYDEFKKTTGSGWSVGGAIVIFFPAAVVLPTYTRSDLAQLVEWLRSSSN